MEVRRSPEIRVQFGTNSFYTIAIPYVQYWNVVVGTKNSDIVVSKRKKSTCKLQIGDAKVRHVQRINYLESVLKEDKKKTLKFEGALG